MAEKPFTVERTNDDVLTLRHDGQVRAGWEQWYLLTADVHWDSEHCNRKLLRKHLAQARERRAGAINFGDLFDAMQGKHDPRRTNTERTGEQAGRHYLDALVDDLVADMEPYRDVWVAFTEGNHETAISNNAETDILRRVAERLGVEKLGYSGWIRLLFSGEGGGRTSRMLYFFHGAGGGGPVTKGTIQTNRRAVYLPDANYVVSGHIHESWMMELVRARVTTAGRTYLDTQVHVQLPTYKQEFDLGGGYHVQSGRPPKPIGGWWLHFYFDGDAPGKVAHEFVRAT